MSTQTDFLTNIKAMIRDDEVILSDPQLLIHLQTAISTYQKRKALGKVYEITGDGSTVQYNVTTFTGWIDGFSWIRGIEYPVRDTGEPEFISSKDYMILELSASKVLRFYFTVPSGSLARVWYAIPHTVDGAGSTIYVADEYAVAVLGASIACIALSGYYNQTARSTITADAIDYFDKGRQYSERGKDFKAQFDEMVPPGRGLGIGDWDMTPSWGTEWMTHSEEQ